MRELIQRACNIGGDKWLHLFVSVLLTFIIGEGVYWCSDYPLSNAGAVGGVAALMIGVAKECYDEFAGGAIDLADLIADAIGCLLGIIFVAL